MTKTSQNCTLQVSFPQSLFILSLTTPIIHIILSVLKCEHLNYTWKQTNPKHGDSYHCLAPWSKQTWCCMMAAVDPRRRHELGSPQHILTIHYHRPGTHSHGNMAVWWRGAENTERRDASVALPEGTEQSIVLRHLPLGFPLYTRTQSQRKKKDKLQLRK